MITCPKHNRWIELRDGTKRDCPECPKRTELRHIIGLGVDRITMLTLKDAQSYDDAMKAAMKAAAARQAAEIDRLLARRNAR